MLREVVEQYGIVHVITVDIVQMHHIGLEFFYFTDESPGSMCGSKPVAVGQAGVGHMEEHFRQGCHFVARNGIRWAPAAVDE